MTEDAAVAYKILTAAEWRTLERDGRFAGSPVDLADGYIHLSAADQVAGTLARHFAGQVGLVLATVDVVALGTAIRWEPSRGGAPFPHLYGVLERRHILSTKIVAASHN